MKILINSNNFDFDSKDICEEYESPDTCNNDCSAYCVDNGYECSDAV